MILKDLFIERIENLRALDNVYIYRRLTIAVVLAVLLLGFGYYSYSSVDPYEQLAINIEEEFSFVHVTHLYRNCLDDDCNASSMFLAFYELYSPGEAAYNQFILRSLNGLYELSGDTDIELVVGIAIPGTDIIGGRFTCVTMEYFSIESLRDNCSLN